MSVLNALIRSRKILAAGHGNVPDYQDGTKVTFHFKTVAIFDSKEDKNSDHDDKNEPECPHLNHEDLHDDTIVDDSKQVGNKPMELFIGKQFKFPLWEEWIKNMRIGEQSELTLDWKFCGDVYPLLSKSYRNFCRPHSDYESEKSRAERTANHCCGMQTKRKYGYKDLDHLVEHPPSKLKFILELLTVEKEDQIDKEVWLMNENEMKDNVPILRKEGNEFYSAKKYNEAAMKYRKALGILEQLMIREKPNDEDWIQLDRQKMPLLSNLAQCELILHEYYQALEHIDEVVKKDPTNVKAYFRRAKANIAVWNIEEARRDYAKVLELDSSLGKLVQEQLIELEKKVKEEDSKNIGLLKGKLFK